MFPKLSRYLKSFPVLGVAILAGLMGAIFLADTYTRYEVAAAVFYVVVILVALRFFRREGVIAVAGVSVALTVISFLMTPDGGEQRTLGLVNGLISISAILITAYLALQRSAAQAAAFEARTQLARMARIQSLSELTASIAHEVNQPLAAIATSGSACQRWLKHEPPNLERAERALQRMIDDAARASQIVERIRHQSRNTPPKMVRLNLADVVDDVLRLAEGELERNQILVSRRFQSDARLVMADGVLIGQVLINLLLNAMEAMQGNPVGSREVTLRVVQHDATNLQVSIADTGPGLSHEARERLFDPFWTTKVDGTGLGLTISRGIIESHGGRLWAEPAARGGSVFCFTLPVVSEEKA